MEIILYSNSAEQNVLDKTSSLTVLNTLNGTLREECNVITPSILFSGVNLELVNDDNANRVIDDERVRVVYQATVNLLNTNYVYIREFNRYYFVTNLIVERTNLIRLELSVDVLMSFKDTIRQQKCFIERNEFNKNPLLIDDKYLVNSEKKYSITQFTGFVTGHTNPATRERYFFENLNGGGVYIITVTGSRSDASGSPILTEFNNVYLASAGAFREICEIVISPDFVNGLTNLFFSFSNYIKSVHYVPFDIIPAELLEPTTEMIVGLAPFTINDGLYKLKGAIEDSIMLTMVSSRSSPTIFTVGCPIPEPNDFTELPPYRNISLILPFIGVVEFDYQRALQSDTKKICVTYFIDISTCKATCVLSTVAPIFNSTRNSFYIDNKHVLNTYECSIGYEVEFSSEDMFANKTRSVINTSVKFGAAIASSGASLGASLGSADDVKRSKKRGSALKSRNMVRSAESSAISSISELTANTINSMLSLSPNNTAYSQVQNDILTIFSDNYIGMIIKDYNVIYPTANSEYGHNIGYCCGEEMVLSDVSGYTIVGAFHPVGFTCTSTELADIEEILTNGFIA